MQSTHKKPSQAYGAAAQMPGGGMTSASPGVGMPTGDMTSRPGTSMPPGDMRSAAGTGMPRGDMQSSPEARMPPGHMAGPRQE
jgi:hypothetical protein